ncbi:MAG: tRNA lysidine(34) synthetase TilS [Caldilineae bacterium]|nr:MAG: tRNA lysidine(34) synthetase TilS [Caldilineae bacterium]
MSQDPLLRAIKEIQERYGLFPAPASQDEALPVVVGVSGGADSVCLLHALMQLAPQWGLSLHVAHLDHGLRPNARKDAEFVADLAARWKLPFHLEQVQARSLFKLDNNLEAAARQARYAFLMKLAQKLAAEQGSAYATVAVAHTAHDQAETVLMHLLRGSGLHGLAGMRPVTHLLPPGKPADASVQSVRLVRPLLHVSRTDVLRYLNDHGLTWREDPSNQDQHFLRNRVRHDLLPRLVTINPNLIATLTRTALILQDEAIRADRLDQEAFDQTLIADENLPAPPSHPPARVVMDLGVFRSLDVASQRGVLRLAASSLDLAEAPSFQIIENLRQQLITLEGAGGPFSLADGYVCTVAPPRFSIHAQEELPFQPHHPFLDRRWRALYTAVSLTSDAPLEANGWRLICRQLPVEELPPHWQNSSDPWQAYLDLHRVSELLLTTPRPGQRFAPLGMGGRHKSLGDFFTDEKTPTALRSGWPIVIDAASTAIVWVCGLRLAHHVRITPATKEVLHLQWLRREEKGP